MADVVVDPDEIDRVARTLAREDAASKHELRHYLRSQGGTAMALVALPVVKKRVAALLAASDGKMRRDTRILLLEFAAKYGLRVRANSEGTMAGRVNFRVTAQQMDLIQDAARRAGTATYAEWCRQVCIEAATRAWNNEPGA